jgi:hypothetical protein
MQDFGQLSDYDFEQLIADLLAAEWGVHVESFPRGPDGGVDLRILGPAPAPLNIPSQRAIFVQCKHMPNASITQLRGHLIKESRRSIVDESYRYIFVTSARLTRRNKQEIATIFSGRLRQADIFGRDDVDALLGRNASVVRANVKLWLSSGAALQAFINQVEHLRSGVLRAELEKLRPRFVQTSIATRAQRLLNRTGVCILAGAPGIGKTTTAKILLLQYMSEGWQPVVAVSDIRELEAQLLPGTKQILFFDDFLGVTGLPSKLARGDDSALVRLLHLVEDDPDKVFILTTRDYILRQAQQDYEKLTDEIFDIGKLVINIQSLSEPERAHILYNELYFSPLRAAAAAAPDGPKRYAALTRHRNYNPRLVEAAIAAALRDLKVRSAHLPILTASNDPMPSADYSFAAAGSAVSPGDTPDVPALIKEALDHPERLWEHVLLNQLTQLQRELLVARLSLGITRVDLEDFLRVTSKLASVFGHKPTRLALDMSLKILDGDLISIHKDSIDQNQIVIGALSPGLTDSINAMIRKYPDYLENLAISACTFEQVLWLAEFSGITRNTSLHAKSQNERFMSRLLDCAQRNLLSPSVAVAHDVLLVKRPRLYFDLGRRLEVLATVYESAQQGSTAEFADKVVPQFLRNISNVPGDEMLRVVRALRMPVFKSWAWRRTQINVTILHQLDDPDGIDQWVLLRDVLDLVEVTKEYEEDLNEKFENFLEETFGNAEDILNEAKTDIDVDLPIDELNELEDLANRWGSGTYNIGELICEFETIRDARADSMAEKRQLDRTANQPTLFESLEAEPKNDTSIFDHL